MTKVGVIGCGHWGPNHVRNFALLGGVEVAGAADRDPARRKAVERLFPWLRTVDEATTLIHDDQIDAIVVATPTVTHHGMVKEALEAGKHVLCEKPLALDVDQCRELTAMASAKERVLMVGHTFLYNPGILKLKALLSEDAAGRLFYMHAERTNLGPIRKDVNVVLDLASHDVSIFNFLRGVMPLSVSARGGKFLQSEIDDVAFINMRYPDNVFASMIVSWLHPRKTRRVTVVGDRKMIVWDDLEGLGPLTVFDKTVTHEPYYSSFGEFNLLAREGDVTLPRVKLAEPLKLEAEHFISCIRDGSRPRSPGEQGVEVALVLDAITSSIAQEGATVEVGSP